jgi:hypothetical protein
LCNTFGLSGLLEAKNNLPKLLFHPNITRVTRY